MASTEGTTEYIYEDSELNHSHSYILPSLMDILNNLPNMGMGDDRRVFELGCGNGAVAYEMTKVGFEVTGVDPSTQGIAQANTHHPELKLSVGSAYDDLRTSYGQFPLVVSLEVVEHVYYPRKYAATLHELVLPGGIAIVSTPYHGYWKNLALALTGKMDKHFTALWDDGHIKFWSIATLTTLLNEAGFEVLKTKRVGRIPILAMSMIIVARKKP
ncbi:MAG: class I SAM-dependent methyltransferase [Candidatus Methylumidiphilus sp.]